MAVTPVTVRGGTFLGRNIGAGNKTVSVPTGTVAGDFLVAFVAYGNNATLTPPAGWTLVPNSATGNGYGKTELYYRFYANGDPTSWTWNLAVTSGTVYWNVQYVSLVGVDTTSPFDANVAFTQIGSATTVDTMPAQSIASTQGTLTLFAIMGIQASGSALSGTNVTAIGNSSYGSVASYSPTSSGNLSGIQLTSASSNATGHYNYSVTLRPVGAVQYAYAPTIPVRDTSATQPGLHVPSANNSSWLHVAPRNIFHRPSSGFVRNPCVFSGTKHAPNMANASVTDLNSRRQHVAMFDAYDLVFIFGNVQSVDQANSNPIQIVSAFHEIPNSSGTSMGDGSNTQAESHRYQITFNGGNSSVTIPGGGYVKSDPLPVGVKKGQVYFTRTYVKSTNGGQIPFLSPAASYLYEGASTSTSDLAGGTNIIPVGGAGGIGTYGPQYVEATPNGRGNVPMVVGVGDSIMEGVQRNELRGWFDQVMTAARIPHTKVSMSGEQAVQWGGLPNLTNSENGHKFRARFLSGATDVVSNYSINDFSSGATGGDMQYRSLMNSALTSRYGARHHVTTLTPKTSTTGGYDTADAQTPSLGATQESGRKAYNAWLRDGAPISKPVTDPGFTTSSVAVGTNTAGTLRAGQQGHPFTGVIDLAASVTVTNVRGEEVWSPNAFVTDGTHPGDSGHNLMAGAFAQYAATHFTAVV